MQQLDWQQRLLNELDEWNFVGEHAAFWWRDDDATTHTKELDQLILLCQQFNIPLALAIIPANMDQTLVSRVRQANQLSAKSIDILIHGFSHTNYAPAGEKKRELGDHRSIETVLSELHQSMELVRGDLAEYALPVLVPPWNRVSDSVMKGLLQTGYSGLSTFSPRTAPIIDQIENRQLWQINSHIDVINWKADRQFVGAGVLVDQVIDHLSGKRTGQYDASEPTGLLTHHLVHNSDTWNFLEELCAVLDEHPAVKWLSASRIFQLKTLAVIEEESQLPPDDSGYVPMPFDTPIG